MTVLGNFSQADVECAEIGNQQKRGGRDDWNGRDVLEYRQANKLKWHESLKDSDVIDYCLKDSSKLVKEKEQARYDKLCVEFGMI